MKNTSPVVYHSTDSPMLPAFIVDEIGDQLEELRMCKDYPPNKDKLPLGNSLVMRCSRSCAYLRVVL